MIWTQVAFDKSEVDCYICYFSGPVGYLKVISNEQKGNHELLCDDRHLVPRGMCCVVLCVYLVEYCASWQVFFPGEAARLNELPPPGTGPGPPSTATPQYWSNRCRVKGACVFIPVRYYVWPCFSLWIHHYTEESPLCCTRRKLWTESVLMFIHIGTLSIHIYDFVQEIPVNEFQCPMQTGRPLCLSGRYGHTRGRRETS